MKNRRLEAEPGKTNLGLRWSCSAGETSLREGEIITIVITIDPLIGRGSISINIFTSTISSQTLLHLLYSVFVPKPQIGTAKAPPRGGGVSSRKLAYIFSRTKDLI